ncbi:hypothetical protein CEXT_635381 [Caerostris extrusa]|uniref:Secreted protein n=1 Tax=Caerostris extrusa TaxID=172846 RepID=A0AAV4UBN7_CAEEX|nr:hypothetical protein CEXT_635381 [Caerostris extrusa]
MAILKLFFFLSACSTHRGAPTSLPVHSVCVDKTIASGHECALLSVKVTLVTALSVNLLPTSVVSSHGEEIITSPLISFPWWPRRIVIGRAQSFR